MAAPSQNLAESLVDQRHVGLIGLDRSGAIVELNDRGREILSQEGALHERDGKLRAKRAKDAQALERLLEPALGGQTESVTGGFTVVGAWPDDRPLTVFVTQANRSHPGVATIVAMVDPWRQVRLNPERIAKSLGLTPAESRVAVALAEGMTAREIAQATNRKPDSVRWLVQQALARTYCSRQADLVRLVLASSHLPVSQGEQG